MSRDSPEGGLSETRAQERLATWGPNRLPDPQRRTWLHTVAEVLREPMFALLLLAAGLYLAVGDLSEGLLLAAFALMTVGLVVLQGRRRERALEALRDLSVPSVQVLRDGKWQRRPATALVPGDWFLIEEGDRVAADAALMQCSGVTVDESLLTGESWPVIKRVAPAPRRAVDASTPKAEADRDEPYRVWAGTVVVSGQGVGEVLQTGARTRMGAIGAALATIDLTDTPAQRRIRALVRIFGLLALAVSLAVVLVHGLWRGDWWAGAVSALALGMGMLPEEFPMALTIFMALGAWRLSRLQVLARRPAAVEALGALTVLCVDKTGTLTENRLRLMVLQTDEVAQRWGASDSTVMAPLQGLLAAACAACRAVGVDPVDQALRDAGAAVRWVAEGVRLQEHPPSAEQPVMAVAWATGAAGPRWFCKGAPESVLRWCEHESGQALARREAAARLARQGWKVLAVAMTDMAADPIALGTEPQSVPQGGWRWLGLVALEDPLREGVAAAVAEVQGAGVKVIMVTGDHVETARAIAEQAGLDARGGVISGEAFAALSAGGQAEVAAQVRLFARVQPEHKLLLVKALQAQGEVVAMTGDGVNDAPALRAAHVGVAMGGRGTDVAREAASMVLLDEDFRHIAHGIALGRRLMDNLRRVSRYITAIHVPLAGLALVPLLMGWPPLMLPAHVVLTEMVIDPLCSLAFENAPPSKDLMKRPPRRIDEPLLMTREEMLGALWLGGVLLLALLVGVACAQAQGYALDHVRTALIVGLTAGNFTLALTALSQGISPRAWIGGSSVKRLGVIGALAASVLLAALTWQPLQRALALADPGGALLAWAVVVGIASVLVGRLLWSIRCS